MSVYGNSRPQFTDINGDPLQGGKLYIGMPDQDPVANPGTVTDLDDNVISATLTLSDIGVPTVAFKVVGDFSQAVFDSSNVEVVDYQITRTGGFLLESDLVGVTGQGGDFNLSKTYGKDDYVKGSNRRYYKSLTANNLGNDPTVVSTSWSRLAWPTLYNVNETYDIDDSTLAPNGLTYLSLVDSNVGNDPVTDNGSNWAHNIPGFTGRNLLFGNFFINQRAVSGTVILSAGEYGHDRFRGGAAGCIYTFAVLNGITTITMSAGSLEQETEGNNIQSGVHVLSWVGTAQAQINGGGFDDTGVSSTLTGGSNSTVEFGNGAGQTLSLPQLKFGSSTTDFEYREFDTDLELCQRYFFSTFAYGTAPGTIEDTGVSSRVQQSASMQHGLDIRFARPMRTLTPTITTYSPIFGTSSRINVAGVDFTSTIQRLGDKGVFVLMSSASAVAINTSAYVHITAEDEL